VGAIREPAGRLCRRALPPHHERHPARVSASGLTLDRGRRSVGNRDDVYSFRAVCPRTASNRGRRAARGPPASPPAAGGPGRCLPGVSAWTCPVTAPFWPVGADLATPERGPRAANSERSRVESSVDGGPAAAYPSASAASRAITALGPDDRQRSAPIWSAPAQLDRPRPIPRRFGPRGQRLQDVGQPSPMLWVPEICAWALTWRFVIRRAAA